MGSKVVGFRCFGSGFRKKDLKVFDKGSLWCFVGLDDCEFRVCSSGIQGLSPSADPKPRRVNLKPLYATTLTPLPQTRNPETPKPRNPETLKP